MPRFVLDDDCYFLSWSESSNLKGSMGVSVTEVYPVSDESFCSDDSQPIAYLHPQKTGSMIHHELEINGVVIDGNMLQKLIEELYDRKLHVNRQGSCFSFILGYGIREDAYYPIVGVFNWKKYGVDVTNPPNDHSWSIGTFSQPHELNSFDKTRSGSVDQSKEIRLDGVDEDLFISCTKDDGGPLNLWKVDCPSSGHIRNVRFMGKIDCQYDMSRLEVRGVTLQGDKLRSLCKELNRCDVMVNTHGWCLTYANNPSNLKARGQEGNHYYKLFFLFNWETYGVPISEESSCIWGRTYYLDEVKTIMQVGEDFWQKEKELKDLGLELEKTKEDLRLCEKQLDEKDQELKKLSERLAAKKNKLIIGNIYREYCSNKSFEKRLQKLSAVSRETHIVLAFARDYDDDNRHTDGKFKEFFDKDVNPDLITNFKKNLPSNSKVKFFLCIGNRSQKYPFRITEKYRWVNNATSSLERIIKHYGFDGIDVYYTSSSSNAKDFVYAIGTVIDELMEQRIITTASLALSPFMNRMDRNFYDTLYKKKPYNFDYVVYQTHDDADSIPLIDAQALITIFNDLVSNHNFPKEKLLAGHSILPKDWDTVPYPVIFTALPKLIKDGTIRGTSMWAITDDQP